MASFYAHGKNFITRLGWLSPLMGGLFPTSCYLISARGKPFAVGRALYEGSAFDFRNCDATAVKEVLVDAEYDFLDTFLSSCEKPVVIDVGAHIGTFSLWLYHRNPHVQVLMVEADPSNYELLVSNVGHTYSDQQYKALNNAAWRNNDALKFSTAGDSMGHKVALDGDIQVKGITFAEIVALALEGQDRIDLMKIDIEGAEEAFFEGAELMLDKVGRVVIELHPKLCDTDKVKGILEKRYNTIREVSRIDAKPVLYCTDD